MSLACIAASFLNVGQYVTNPTLGPTLEDKGSTGNAASLRTVAQSETIDPREKDHQAKACNSKLLNLLIGSQYDKFDRLRVTCNNLT
jgi:hypothetical protein